MTKLKPHWQKIIANEQQQDYFQKLSTEVSQQRSDGEVILPLEADVFSAFSSIDLADVKVVILGQDPYHGLGKNGESQAHGLAFSVRKGIKVPPSLVNIYKELAQDITDFKTPGHGYLVEWAEQGVLMLNTVLTVKQGQAHSHAKLGWEIFTDNIIAELNKQNAGCVFLLWGSHAQKKGKNIDENKHYVLNGPHPSPLSAYRGFFGCQHFSKANQWLKSQNQSMINWQVSD
ncbi:uracil-DNA glycosylase [Colwellia sp. 6M3]|jgi:uracil-DNA glycosylase|uniref:uracil-DNA glycosylase n=1 Tax=Colwellia sp. 6M3 TaxID=2759849 RepID=UPI0015F529AC|nr:uracil-DNA glycosylase [Colwellia sp. 6M3]MBA6414771.1 uracil-DNA glycosylase [Colwellia sp. 6M3]